MSDVLGVIAQGYNPLTQANNVVGFQRQQTALQQERFNLQQAQLQPAYAGLNALLENPNANWGDVQAALANSQRLGGNVDGLVQNASAFAAQGGSPADFVRQYGTARYVPPFEAANLFLPQYAEQRTAMGTYPGQVSGPATTGGPQWSPTGFVRRGVTPEEYNQPVPVGYNPQTGAVMTAPYGSVYSGMPGMGGGGMPAFSGPGGMVGMGGGGPATGGGAGGPVPGGGALGMIKQEALMNVMLRESGGRDIMNTQGSGAGGLFQMMPPTWAEGKQLAGIPEGEFPQAQGSPPQVQYAVASALYDRYGTAPWQASAANAGRFPGAQAAMLTANGIPAAGGGGPVQNAAYYPPMPGMGPSGTGGMGPGGGAALPPGFVSIYGPGMTGQPPAPGVMEGAKEAAAGATGRQQALVAAQNTVPGSRSILEGMLADMATPGFTSGVGHTTYGNLRQVLQNSGIAPQNMDIQQGQAAQEQFNKFVSQLSAQTMQMIGAPSDARQEMAAASNPSLMNTVAGNRAIVRMLLGNLQSIDVMTREFQGSGLPPSMFDQWRLQFTARDPRTGGQFDPRIFWMANMPPDEQRSYFQKNSPAVQRQLSNDLEFAARNGWISQNADKSIGNNW